MDQNNSQKPRILIVDDDVAVRSLLINLLDENYNCTAAESAEEAAESVESAEAVFHVIISDINLGGMSGIDLLPLVRSMSPHTAILMISGNQTIDSAIGAIHGGAFDYIKKPFDLENIEKAVRRAVEHHDLLVEKQKHDQELEHLVRQRTDQLNMLAFYDELTELPNRTLFQDRLSQAILQAGGQDAVGVMIISLNRFKDTRDTFGRSVGDKMLREIARRLTNCSDLDSTVARLDADEFAVLLPKSSANEIAHSASKIFEALKSPLQIENDEISAACGIGISLYPEDGADAQSIMKNAGAALSRANRRGPNNYQLYTEDIHLKALERLTLENSLRRALDRRELELFYQPTVNTISGQIVGCEALLRWRHPEMGLILPDRFIPLAEETGSIVEIGEWVIRRAFTQAKSWQLLGFPLNISVNVSAKQLEGHLADTVQQVIWDTNLDPSCLNLEVTESSIMTDPLTATAILNDLKDIGVKISIDDFGTGYSSLGYLKHLPIDVLKIDRSFIKDVTHDAADATLVTAIVGLAHNFRMDVVAEGVEFDDQVSFLRRLRCDEWQGYLCSRPIAADEFYELLEAKSRAAIPARVYSA